jgi:TATA-binding protein-associated factor
MAKAVKKLNADHKILLSGTPIQNNILELWSIFDFLMPGYLGDEEHFRAKYNKYFQANIFKLGDDTLLFTDEQSTFYIGVKFEHTLPA